MKKLFFAFLLALVVGISAKAETVTVYYDNSQDYNYQYHGTMSDSVTEIYFYQSSQYDYDLNQNVYYWYVTAIGTHNESATVPDSVMYNGTTYPVNCFGYHYDIIALYKGSPLNEIHLPSTITNCDGYLPSQILSLYLTSPQVISFYNSGFFENMNPGLEIVVDESLYNTYYSYFQNDYSLSNAASRLTYERVATNFYTITVNTPGTLAQEYFNVATNWADVDELTVIGSIDESDMKWFSRMTNLSKLDLQQTNITTIKGCFGLKRLKTVILPSTVTSVSDSAFMNCSKLDSLVIPNNITSIGKYAFYSCTRLNNVPLQNVQSLGSYALYEIPYQNSVLSMPALTMMEERAFMNLYYHAASGNYYLDTLYLPLLTAVPINAFANDAYNGSSGETYISNYVLPAATTIGDDAFEYNDIVRSVDMPVATTIGGYAFYDCNRLSKVNMPEVTTIDYGAFKDCTSLSSVDMPSIKYIHAAAFYNCPIDTLILPASINLIDGGSNDQYSSSAMTFNTNTLTEVYCYAPIPITTSAFSNVNATLHVPAFSLTDYRIHDSWSSFSTIVPIDTLCDKLVVSNNYNLATLNGLVENPSISLLTGGNLNINTDTVVRLADYNQSSYTSEYIKHILNSYRKYYLEHGIDEDIDLDVKPYFSSLIVEDTVSANAVYKNISIKTNIWNFISLPFDVDVADIVVPDSTYWVIRRYSGQDRANLTGNSWQNMTAGMTLNANEGYIIHCQSAKTSRYHYEDEIDEECITFTFYAKNNTNKDKIFANGNVALPLNKYASAKAVNSNWNLVGNPYPCFFNSSAIQHNGIITVWNGDDYTAYSLVDDQFTLFPGEAFFVQCPNNASSMTFLASGRTRTYNTAVASYAPANFLSTDDNVRKVYNLTLSHDTLSDHTRFVINPSASVDYEISCDAGKFTRNSTTSPDFYMVENEEHLAIDERNMASGIFNLGFIAKVAGNYTIALESNPDAATRPYITDKQTGEKKCLENSPYTFYTAVGTFDERFIITFDEVAADIDNAESESESDFMENGDVYAMDGRFVMHFENRMELENLSTGTYVLRNEVSVEKFVKK